MPPPKVRTKRELQRLRTREAILQAAKNEMLRQGYDRATVRNIASHARVAVGTVITHFGSKESLLYEVLYEDIEQVVSDVQASRVTSGTLSEQLIAAIDRFLLHYASEPDLYYDLLKRALFTDGPWGQKFKSQVERFGHHVAQLFRRAIERGEIDPSIDIVAEVTTFFSFYYFVLIQQISARFRDLDTGRSSLEALINNHLERLKP